MRFDDDDYGPRRKLNVVLETVEDKNQKPHNIKPPISENVFVF
jgi:hypothetical protein